MKKILFVLAAAVVLAGCSPSYQEKTDEFLLPSELSDCKIYNISATLKTLYVTRCPKSDTSTSWESGKTTYYSVTVEE